MSRIIVLLALFVPNSFYASAQCQLWSNLNDCGSLNYQGGVCNSATIFCVGDSVGVENLSSPANVDSSFICWDDGTIQSFAGIFPGCVKHYYNYDPDSCVGGNGQIQKQIKLGIKKTCSSGESFHFIITPIDIKFKPHASIAVNPIVVCVNTQVTIINNSCPNSSNPTHFWDFGDGTTSNSQNPGSHIYNTPGTYTISYTVTNSCGTSTDTTTVTILPPTTIQPIISILDSCTPSQFVPITNPQNVFAYNWGSIPTSGISISSPSVQQPTFNVNSSGTFSISLNVTGCCSAPQSICHWDTAITFFQGPNLSASPIPDGCNSLTLNPSNYINVSGNVSSYNWQFAGGNPASSNSSNPGNVTYSIPGTYPISLVVLSPCGTDSITDTVKVLPPTVISPLLNVNGTCVPLNINADMNALNANSTNWSLIPSSVGTIQTPGNQQTIIDITSPGTFTIYGSASGCCTSTQSICAWDTTLSILQGPVLSSIPIPTFCNSVTISPANYFSYSGSITTYSWNFPGGNPGNSIQQNPGNVSFNSPGQYIITLTVAGSCGTDSVSSVLEVGASPVLNLNSSNLFGCDSQTVSFQNLSPPNQTYNWIAIGGNFINGTTSISSEPTISFSSPGIYTVEVNASTPGCNPASSIFAIEIGEAPDISQISLIDDICDTTYLDLTAYFSLIPNISDSGYLWNVSLNGNSIYSSTNSNPSAILLQDTGLYIASVLVWNACDSIVLSDTFNFQFPPVLIIPLDTTVCKGSGVIPLSASPANGTWTWNNNVITTGYFDPSLTFVEENYILYTLGTGTCQVKDSILISVIGANINAGPDYYLCSNSSSIILSGIPLSGTWYGIGVVDSIMGVYDPQLVVLSPDTVIYSYFNSTFGCLVTDTTLVTIYQPTNAGFYMIDSACVGQPLAFIDTIPNTISTWDFGDGSGTIVSNNITHIYNSSGQYNVTLIIENNYGCFDTITQLIEIAEPPNASFTLYPKNGCSELNVTLTNTSSYYSGNHYNWNYGNGVADTIFNPGVINFIQGIGDSTQYIISLNVSNVCGTASFYDSIIVYPIPVPDFGIVYSDSCSPALVNFNNVTTGNPQFYQWFINGTFITIDSVLPQQIFTADTTDSTYNIMLIASNFCGSDTIVKTIIVHPNQVVAFFNSSIVYGCQPLSVTFTSYVAPNSIIQWDFGDGNTALGLVVTHVYDTAGTFTIWQFVDNYCGFDSVSQTIEVLAKPELSFNVSNKACRNESIDIVNTSQFTSGALWDFGDGSPVDTSSNPSHVYTVPGIYTITYIGFANGTGCSDTISKNIEIVDIPTASFNAIPVYGCVPLNVNLFSTSLNTFFYLYEMGNGDTLFGGQQNYTYTSPGQYTITHIAIDTNGCKHDTSFSYVNVYAAPQAMFTYNQTPLCDLPTTIQFNNTSTGSNAYQWNFGIFGNSNQQNPTLYFNAVSTLNVQLVAFSTFGCSDTIDNNIFVYGATTAQFNPLHEEGCPPLLVYFDNLSENFNSAFWDFGDGNTSTTYSPVNIYSTPGTYNTTLVVSMDSVCFDSITINNNIEVLTAPIADFNYEIIMDTLINHSGLYSFTDLSSNSTSWLWSFGDGFYSNEQFPVHRYYMNGNMIVTLVVFNDLGCSDTIIKTITINYLGSLYIPNAFSPEAGTDETMHFIPKGVGLKEYLIEVFSPFGEKVWSSSKLLNGQPVEKWDGTFHGKILPQGVYAWKAFAIFDDGRIWEGMSYKEEKFSKVGSLTLLR